MKYDKDYFIKRATEIKEARVWMDSIQSYARIDPNLITEIFWEIDDSIVGIWKKYRDNPVFEDVGKENIVNLNGQEK